MESAGIGPVDKAVAAAGCGKHAYAGDEGRPLGSFLALMGVYGTATAAMAAVVRGSSK